MKLECIMEISTIWTTHKVRFNIKGGLSLLRYKVKLLMSMFCLISLIFHYISNQQPTAYFRADRASEILPAVIFPKGLMGLYNICTKSYYHYHKCFLIISWD